MIYESDEIRDEILAKLEVGLPLLLMIHNRHNGPDLWEVEVDRLTKTRIYIRVTQDGAPDHLRRTWEQGGASRSYFRRTGSRYHLLRSPGERWGPSPELGSRDDPRIEEWATEQKRRERRSRIVGQFSQGESLARRGFTDEEFEEIERLLEPILPIIARAHNRRSSE